MRFLDRTLTFKLWKLMLAALLLPILVFWYLVVHQLDEIIALTRNELVIDARGQRSWQGRFTNTDDIPYRDLAITLHFLDAEGRVVYELEARRDVLQGGESMNLQAPLPDSAVKLRIYSLQWRNDRRAALLGPFREAWDFGYLMAGASS